VKVSIIVSSYNYERYVAEAIESSFAQSYPDIEVVVVDDGSTDGSPEIIRRYEGRAKLLFKKNGGQASAFNLAYQHCTGDLVVFLDCDDALRPDAVEKSVAAWTPGCSKVHFPLEVITEDGTRTGALVPRADLPAGDVRAQLLEEGMYVTPPNTGNAFSRDFLDRIMPMPEREWAYAPDSYLVFLAPLYGTVAAVQEPLGYYRRHVASVTNITVAGLREIGSKLQSMAQSCLDLRALLVARAAALGMSLGPDAVSGHWLCLKVRLAMARVAPELDPFGPAGVWPLAFRMLRSVWRTAELRPPGRIGLTAWTLLLAGLPLSASVFLIKFAFAPGERGALVRRALGRPPRGPDRS
jgi:hypothetical protein